MEWLWFLVFPGLPILYFVASTWPEAFLKTIGLILCVGVLLWCFLTPPGAFFR
jgi:hypothetical protein